MELPRKRAKERHRGSGVISARRGTQVWLGQGRAGTQLAEDVAQEGQFVRCLILGV